MGGQGCGHVLPSGASLGEAACPYLQLGVCVCRRFALCKVVCVCAQQRFLHCGVGVKNKRGESGCLPRGRGYPVAAAVLSGAGLGLVCSVRVWAAERCPLVGCIGCCVVRCLAVDGQWL